MHGHTVDCSTLDNKIICVNKLGTVSCRLIGIDNSLLIGINKCGIDVFELYFGVFALNLALALRESGIRAFLDELEADDNMDWGDTVMFLQKFPKIT